MKKRILSIILTVAMLVCVVPISAMTASAASAWNSSNTLPTSGDYYLTRNVTLNGKIVLTGSLDLDLNGYTVTFTGTQGGSAIDLDKNKNFFCVTASATEV